MSPLAPVAAAMTEAEAADITPTIVCELPTGNSELSFIKQNLVTRKTLLKNLLDCSEAEVAELRDSVAAIDPAEDRRIAELKEHLLKALDEARAFYAEQRAGVDTLETSGAQDLAKTLKEARSDRYIPLAKQAANFLLWNRNARLIEAAEKRINQVSPLVSLLKFFDSETIPSIYTEAKSGLEKTNVAHEGAKGSFLVPPTDVEHTRALIQSSLENLTAVYTALFRLREEVRRVFEW